VPASDSYGQGIQIARRTDAPDAEKLATDLAAMLGHGVLEYATEAERNATLTSPTPGMVAYVASIDSFTGYTTAGWMVLAAGGQAWTTISLNSGWTHDGNSNGDFQYRVVNLFGEPTIMFRGAVGRSSYPGTLPSYFTLNSTLLPVSARTSTLRTITVPCSDISSARITLKLDLATNGELRLYGVQSDSKPPWIGFNGCFCSL